MINRFRPSDTTTVAWHFLPNDSKTQFDPRIPVSVGTVLEVPADRVKLCKYGLHASSRIIDALQYAPGAMLCRVQLSGKILQGDDKLVASRREVLAMADATAILHEMAWWSAEQCLQNIKDDQHRAAARAAIDATRGYLAGKVTAKELSAAESAARSAAESAAWSAAESAAESAARSAQETHLVGLAKQLLGCE